MAKSKQVVDEVAQEEPFLFAIGTPEGETVVKVGVDGNLMYLKDEASLTDASKAFWNSLQVFLPVSIEEVEEYPNDEALGKYVRERMHAKLNQ